MRNEAGQLLFLSVFGRDTSIQQLLASFALGAKEGGLTQFKLQRPGAGDELVLIGDAGRLEKLTGRLPRQNLFGNLTHAWIFDPALVVGRLGQPHRVAHLRRTARSALGGTA